MKVSLISLLVLSASSCGSDDGGGGDASCPPGTLAFDGSCVQDVGAAGTAAAPAAGATGGAGLGVGAPAPAGAPAPGAGAAGAPAVPTSGAGGAEAPTAGAAGGETVPVAGEMATAGAAGMAPADPGPGPGSSGCGSASPPADGMQTLDVDGTPREFIVTLPAGYDPNTPYELIFAWHGLGGTANGIASRGYYGLASRAGGSAIFVAGQGLDTSNAVGSGPGWDNMGGRDVAFTAAMLQWLRGSYCIDDSRIFSVGMSYGGIMSNTVGCQLGEDFRAIAPMAGSGPRSFFGSATCVGQVAAWITHGNQDMVVQFSSGQASRDYWVEANHCATTSAPAGGNGCVAYDGCDAGYPVVWCEFTGGHTVPSFASEEVWAFFSQF